MESIQLYTSNWNILLYQLTEPIQTHFIKMYRFFSVFQIIHVVHQVMHLTHLRTPKPTPSIGIRPFSKCQAKKNGKSNESTSTIHLDPATTVAVGP